MMTRLWHFFVAGRAKRERPAGRTSGGLRGSGARNIVSIFFCMLLTLGFDLPSSFSASPWLQPVGRLTSDRDADLIAALIGDRRFDDALGICESPLRGADPKSDEAAKWTIRQSQVLTARQMGSDRFDESDIQIAQKPTATLLLAYPDHRRRLFLEAQNIAVEREAALHGVLRAAVSPTNDTAREIAATRLLRAKTAIESLSARIGDARSELNAQGGNHLGLIDDLVRLQQELQIDAVSLALMQTELFARGSVDCIAAATKAESAADEAIAKLPADTPARVEVRMLKVEAIFRAEQLARARAELDDLTRALGKPTAPRVQAMHVRQDIAGRRMERAAASLASFFGEAPENAPTSIEMDLARLEFLLHSGQSVGGWLDAIERRGGGYARRRAEAISLASLRRSRSPGDSSPTRPMVDPSLVAAQGQDWLRRGEPGRAGELLSAAAAAQPDPDRAIQRAGEAAAALVSAGRSNDAAQVLADISLAKPDGANAAAAHLQAILLVSSTQASVVKGDGVSERLEQMLRANLKQWPSGETAAAARKWLQKLLIGQQRHVEAAEVATNLSVAEITPENLGVMVDLWRAAFRSQEDESLKELSRRFQASFDSLLDSPLARSQYRLAAALLLDRELLSALPSSGGDQTGSALADALLDFRTRGLVSDSLRKPHEQYVEDATLRLMRDGRKHAELRKPIAELISHWDTGSDASLERAERLIWVGDSAAAVAMVRDLIGQRPGSAEIIMQAARILGSSDSQQANQEAIKLWDELAAGSKQGSRMWHEAKLAAIESLHRNGNQVEAKRRAKYVLLTAPVIDDDLKRRYQSASR